MSPFAQSTSAAHDRASAPAARSLRRRSTNAGERLSAIGVTTPVIGAQIRTVLVVELGAAALVGGQHREALGPVVTADNAGLARQPLPRAARNVLVTIEQRRVREHAQHVRAAEPAVGQRQQRPQRAAEQHVAERTGRACRSAGCLRRRAARARAARTDRHCPYTTATRPSRTPSCIHCATNRTAARTSSSGSLALTIRGAGRFDGVDVGHGDARPCIRRQDRPVRIRVARHSDVHQEPAARGECTQELGFARGEVQAAGERSPARCPGWRPERSAPAAADEQILLVVPCIGEPRPGRRGGCARRRMRGPNTRRPRRVRPRERRATRGAPRRAPARSPGGRRQERTRPAPRRARRAWRRRSRARTPADAPLRRARRRRAARPGDEASRT